MIRWKDIPEVSCVYKLTNTKTGEEYDSIIDAARKTGVNHRTLRDYLRGNIRNKTNLIIYGQA